MDNFNTSWKKLLNDAGITNFRFHDCRHCFASRLVQNGVDLYVVAQLLGHERVEMTQKYAHLRPDNLRDAISVLDNTHSGKVSQIANVE